MSLEKSVQQKISDNLYNIDTSLTYLISNIDNMTKSQKIKFVNMLDACNKLHKDFISLKKDAMIDSFFGEDKIILSPSGVPYDREKLTDELERIPGGLYYFFQSGINMVTNENWRENPLTKLRFEDFFKKMTSR